ncbi:MAG TPA: PAS domain S-box protein, partial [Anaerolineae bacterium]|nr:PAS domain S-box protein [Anaerolineae bacterium]
MTMMPDSDKTKAQLIEELQVLRWETARLRPVFEPCEGEEKFRAVFDLSPDAIFLAHAATGLIVDANLAAAELVQRPLEQLIGRHQTELHPPEQLALAKATFAYSPPPGQKAPPVEIEVLCAGQTRKPVEIRGQIIHLGNEAYVLGTFRDISERKQAEAQLQQNRRELRTLLDAVSESMLLIKPDGEVIECNEAVARRLGQTRQALIGHDIYAWLPPDVAESRRANVQRVMETGQALVFQDESYGRIINQVVNPVLNASGDIYALAIFGTDITEQR